MHSIFLNNLTLLDLTEAELIYYVGTAFLAVIILAGLSLVYFSCRPLLPIRVNCWFCNNHLWVPFNERNCFDCRICGQYNGFTKDGDYNKDVVPALADTENLLNKDTERANGLCQTCNVNQQLKVQQLASFVPFNDANYDSEIDQYREQLEKAYRLCDECNLVLTQTLQTQHYNMLTQRLNGHCPTASQLPSFQAGQGRFANVPKIIVSLSTIILRSASVVTLLLSCLAYFNYLDQWPAVHSMIGGKISELLMITSTIGSISSVVVLLVTRQFTSKNLIQVGLWGGLQSMSYTMHLHALIILAAISALISLAWKQSSTQGTVHRIVKNSMVTNSPAPVLIPEQTKMNYIAEVSQKPRSEVVGLSVKKSQQPIVQDAEGTATNNVIETPVEVVAAEVSQATSRVVTRSQKSKQDKEKNDEDKLAKKPRSRHRSQSPPLEVYQGMNDLRLGSPEPNDKSRKPANYLFEKLSFSKKQNKTVGSILRPSKFQVDTPKGSFSPKVFSSTPTPESAFSDLDVTAVSPLQCISKYPPPMAISYNYDYPFSSNVFCPPVGQTTMYTYSRPSPYPCGFPASFAPAHAPPYDCSMSPHSDAASSSHSQTGSAFNATQPAHGCWEWIKRAANIISVVINVVILVVLLLPYLKN